VPARIAVSSLDRFQVPVLRNLKVGLDIIHVRMIARMVELCHLTLRFSITTFSGLPILAQRSVDIFFDTGFRIAKTAK
jgi:hypothetical protein